jgi:hypothetical protein
VELLDRDPTDVGLPDRDWSRVGRVRLPRAPRPKPLGDEPGTHGMSPSERVGEHVQRIAAGMGWRREPDRQRQCPVCLAMPGQLCVTSTNRRMLRDMHPARRVEVPAQRS